MKKLLAATCIILSITYSATAQRWAPEWGVNYVYSAPLGSMKSNIRQGNGIAGDFAMVAPSRRFSVGIEVQYSMYGHDKSRKQFDMDDGTTADMDISVSNSFANFMVAGRFNLLPEGKFQPYVTAKAGYSHYRTDLYIYDPADDDNCQALESDLLQRDGTLVGSVGAGLRVDFSTVMTRINSGRLFLDLATTVSQGGTVKYMNTDAPSHHPTHDAADAVNGQFINTETQVVHSHHVGSLYSSPIQLMEFRLGLSYRLLR